MEKHRVNEVCQVTGLSRKTIYRKMEKGILPFFIENGRRYIKNSDLDIFLTSIHNQVNVKKNECCCVRLHEEVTQLRLEIEKLTLSIESMTQPKDTVKEALPIPKKNNNSKLSGDNAKRSEEAKQRLFLALSTMEEIPLYRGKPSITGIYRATGIDRGTISKYIDEYMCRS